MAKKVVKVTKKAAAKAKNPSPVKETTKDDQENGTDNKKYTCPYCNQAFARKYDMEKHSRKHTGDKPYKCGICGKQFVQGKSGDHFLSFLLRRTCFDASKNAKRVFANSIEITFFIFVVGSLAVHMRSHTGEMVNYDKLVA